MSWLAEIRARFERHRSGGRRPLQHGPFEAGQVWTLLDGVGSEHTRLIVLRTEAAGQFGNIIHVAIEDLALDGPSGTIVSRIAHMPFSDDAIDRSVGSLIERDAALPDYQSEYDSWLNDDEGRGIFTVPVHVIVGGVSTARRL